MNNFKKSINNYLIVLFVAFFININQLKAQTFTEENNSFLPQITNQTKPWTRWWWMGSAVDSLNLKQNLINLQKIGIGGVEIAPIYGVKGEEANFIDYLSPKWMAMLNYTITIADSLDIQVDLTLGTGWPFGGPQVTPEFAATKLITQKYSVKKNDVFSAELKIENSKEKQPTTLKYVLAYGEHGNFINLTSEVQNNKLNWEAKTDDYTIYAVFTGKTGQKVKRAAPGANGFTLDHYSESALNTYLKPFNKALDNFKGKIRCVFNDSYEVYDTDFTPNFFDAFKKFRGYDLKLYLPLLFKQEDNEEGNRVKCDYRETLSDLLLHDFDEPWTRWAHTKNFKSRLQAHGSPGNLIDLYASADIPECETFGSMPYDIPGLRREKEDIREGDADPVMLKFSSSAAHISGKTLTSSETFTWLRDHFKVALSQCKPEVEELFINGINHVFLHGTTYSPNRAEWPGWKFYASVNFNPNMVLGEDESHLFSYISNCQSLLQSGKPDNETLIYWPIYDVWNTYLKGSLFFQFKIHSLSEWLHNEPFYITTKSLIEKGFALDFISDNFIAKATFENGSIQLPGGSYKSLVIPTCKYIPLKTLNNLIALKKQGANIIFESLPESVPGFNYYKEDNIKLKQLLEEHKTEICTSNSVFTDLNNAQIYPETLVNTGLKYIRRNVDGEKLYYLVNHTSKAINQFIPINSITNSVLIIDPKTNNYGEAKIKLNTTQTLVKVNLKPGDAIFLKTSKGDTIKKWDYFDTVNTPISLYGNWNISFLKGGPELPESFRISELKSWTTLSQKAEAFSGTAKYTLEFQNPDTSVNYWQLHLGDVRESAKVWVNDKFIGTLWANPFEINIENLNKGTNTLTLEVTNLSANRIRAKELRGEEWKIFYEINMVNKDYDVFDATKWQPMPSGVLGPVTITPLKKN